jgi:hypothetical protein
VNGAGNGHLPRITAWQRFKFALGKSKTLQTFLNYSLGICLRMISTLLCALIVAVTPGGRRVDLLQEKLSNCSEPSVPPSSQSALQALILGQHRSVDSLTSLVFQTPDIETPSFYRVAREPFRCRFPYDLPVIRIRVIGVPGVLLVVFKWVGLVVLSRAVGRFRTALPQGRPEFSRAVIEAEARTGPWRAIALVRLISGG